MDQSFKFIVMSPSDTFLKETVTKKIKVFLKYIYHSLDLASHDFLKVSLIEAFITTHNIDIVCLSETFLDSTVPHNDGNININGYSLLRVDHLNTLNEEEFKCILKNLCR